MRGDPPGPSLAPLRRLVGRGASAIVFCIVIVPIGLVMRAVGRDRLRLRHAPDAASYWIVRGPPGAPGSMARQR